MAVHYRNRRVYYFDGNWGDRWPSESYWLVPGTDPDEPTNLSLPADYRLVTGPNGTVSVQCISEPNWFFSLDAWKQIERGEGLWKDAHKAIFGQEQRQ